MLVIHFGFVFFCILVRHQTPTNMQNHWYGHFKSNHRAFVVFLSLHLRVEFTDVSVSVPGLCKSLCTVGAGVRSLPCVYPHVNI